MDRDTFINKFLPSLEDGKTSIGRLYVAWMRDNPNQATVWGAAIDAVRSGNTPTIVSMGSKFGQLLMAAAEMAQPDGLLDYIIQGSGGLSGSVTFIAHFAEAPSKVELLDYDSGKVLASATGDGTKRDFSVSFDTKQLANGPQDLAIRTPAGLSTPIAVTINN